MIYHDALNNPDRPCPPELLAQQVGLAVLHYGFDGRMHRGIIEVHEEVADDVASFFDLALRTGFPIERVARSGDPEFGWDDDKLMAANVSSGFNYRTIAGTDRVSLHGQGRAFDVNPRQNPYVRYTDGGEVVAPAGAEYDPQAPGTLSAGHRLVGLMQRLGWEWGGDWQPESGRVDYQHFQKS